MADGLVRSRADLVGPPALEELPAPEEEPEVRPEELVRRAEHDVEVELGAADRPVRREVHGVAREAMSLGHRAEEIIRRILRREEKLTFDG